MHRRLRIAIVSPNEIRREGLRQVLVECGFTVDQAVGDPLALHVVASIADAIPLVVVEGQSDDASLAICRDVHARWPDHRIIILGQATGSRLVAEAFQAGTDGYVSHDTSCASLAKMLTLIALGEKVIPPNVVFDLAARSEIDVVAASETHINSMNLSEREISTLRGLIRGDPNKQISRHLGIAEATVKIHVKAILRKLKVLNRTQAAIWAVKHEAIRNPAAARESTYVKKDPIIYSSTPTMRP